jgi:hypothetical protein
MDDFFLSRHDALEALDLLIIKASRSHSDTPTR